MGCGGWMTLQREHHAWGDFTEFFHKRGLQKGPTAHQRSFSFFTVLQSLPLFILQFVYPKWMGTNLKKSINKLYMAGAIQNGNTLHCL